MDITNSFILSIGHFEALSYFFIFLIFFLEAMAFIGLLVPGSILLVFIGFLSAEGVLGLKMSIFSIMAGALAGDFFSFYLGRKGNNIFKKGRMIFSRFYLEKGENFFKKHGNKSVILGRFIGPIRPFVSFISGLLKMSAKEFFLFNFVSLCFWVAFYLFLGFFFGHAWRTIEVWSSRTAIVLILLFLFFFAAYLLKKFFVRQGKQTFSFLKLVWISIKEAISANPEVKKIVARHPAFFNFFKKRTERAKFSGLPLTLLGLAFLYVFFLLAGIVEDVVTSDAIVFADIRIENLIAVFRNPALVEMFVWITLLGKSTVVVSFTVVLSLLFWLWRKKKYILPLWATVGGAAFFTFLGKIIFHRPRPLSTIYFERTFSFPSGHAALALAFFGFLAYFFWRTAGRWKAKINIFFLCTVIVILVGLSRLYLGAHYLSDVWGGYLLGALWLIIGISLTEWLSSRREKIIRAPSPAVSYARLFSAAIILLELAFLAGFKFNYKPEYIIPGKDAEIKSVAGVFDIFSFYHLPKYSETLIAARQEPLSFLIIAKDDDAFIGAFREAGWYLADQASLRSLGKMAGAVFFKKSYPTAPMTPSFWDAEAHNFGFEKPLGSEGVSARHHARFWRTNYMVGDGRIYVGTASLDTKFKWGLVHKISPDIDTEREYIFNGLTTAGAVEKYQKEKFVDPVLGMNFAGGQFFTDGEIYVVYLSVELAK